MKLRSGSLVGPLPRGHGGHQISDVGSDSTPTQAKCYSNFKWASTSHRYQHATGIGRWNAWTLMTLSAATITIERKQTRHANIIGISNFMLYGDFQWHGFAACNGGVNETLRNWPWTPCKSLESRPRHTEEIVSFDWTEQLFILNRTPSSFLYSPKHFICFI